MNWIDFLIGFFLMNAMPHFVLGIWKGRMLSAFGFGNRQNLLYSAVQFVAAIALFFYQYGWQGLAAHGIFAGALLILVLYYLTGKFFYERFKQEAA
ncbi:MAG: hypothetical protein AAFR61_02555 [Bacteroidota bacterium]